MTNIGKTELIEKIAETAEYTKKEIASVIDALIETITNSVSKGEKVALTGFGTFEAVKRAARTGINPATGQKIQIPAKTAPKFKAGKAFKNAVQG